jgi:hypothetical protein
MQRKAPGPVEFWPKISSQKEAALAQDFSVGTALPQN